MSACMQICLAILTEQRMLFSGSYATRRMLHSPWAGFSQAEMMEGRISSLPTR